MLYDEIAVRDNIRNREGKRVFFLRKEDRLTPSARDYLSRERITVLPAEQAKIHRYVLPGGGYMEEKPEHMTHLSGDILVHKTHPRIQLRGAVDTLEAELLLCQFHCKELCKPLQELLALARRIIACEVLGEQLKETTLCGLSEDDIRKRSHFPQEYYGQPHFMPEASHGAVILQLNRCRCAARSAELAAAAAFTNADGTCSRPDLLRALNRMSSMLYLLMIQQKANA